MFAVTFQKTELSLKLPDEIDGLQLVQGGSVLENFQITTVTNVVCSAIYVKQRYGPLMGPYKPAADLVAGSWGTFTGRAKLRRGILFYADT